jgi:O-acetyl-ADP-ribose deacetylase (regulator of RNase III)
MPSSIRVIQGDITTLACDAVVNAANEGLRGGGGVDGAIHRAAGPALGAACRAVPEVRPGVRCPTGEARVTPAFRLPARWIIHTAGPVWRGGRAGEAELLAACHRNALDLARAHAATGIAFPAISCGVYGYPAGLAAEIAVGAARAWAAGNASPCDIVFCCFGADTAAAFRAALGVAAE